MGADSARLRGYIHPPGMSGLFVLRIPMTVPSQAAELDARRKKLRFRCWHRGIREMDLIMGGFADAHLAAMTDSELDELERLIEVSDHDLYASIAGTATLQADLENGPLFMRMKAFGRSGVIRVP
jgi:antitoxin CptB